MVACQWNYNKKADVSHSVYFSSIIKFISRAPRSCGRVMGHWMSFLQGWRLMDKLSEKNHTKSSPIGPAEQDEGGSLWYMSALVVRQ